MESGDEHYGQFYNEASIRLKDLEERQRVLRDRVLLIGKNLIDTKESLAEKSITMKKDIESLKQDMERIKSFMETLSGEFSKFARKEDLDILSKQAKMFQPLNLMKKSKGE
ncbi:MAG: hypothetical protein WDZ77_00985 [Candidatus Pacearchaeota archaeon]